MPESLERFLAELKRRRVFRVAGVYALVAWALIQVSDIIFPALGLPAWTITLVVVLVALGFPAAMALAWAFDVTPDGVRRTVASELEPAIAAAPAGAGRAPNRLIRRGAWFVLGFLVAGSGAWVAIQRRGDATLDTNMVAVLPFRVSGDPSLEYLRGGMLDLLAATLTGEGGPRSSEPRSLLAAWKRAVSSENDDLPEDAAIDLARGLGAGQVLLGGIVGTPRKFTLTAKVLSVPGGRPEAQESVTGSEDQLTELVEELTVKLLTQLAGEQEPGRASSLAGASLPVLRSYLAGRAANRSGHYEEAAEHFRNVLAQDSTFALAAFDLSGVYAWSADLADRRPELDRLAFESRHRLSPRDQKLLLARLGPNYPAYSGFEERLKAAEEAVAIAPDRPEAWYGLGDYLFHNGRRVRTKDYTENSRRALERAVELDSTYVGPMIHLVELASHARDVERVKKIATAAIRADSTGETAQYMRWYLARASGSPSDRAKVRADFASMKPHVRRWLMMTAIAQPWDTLDVNDAALALAASTAAATSQDQRAFNAWNGAVVLSTLGRPGAAEQHRVPSLSSDAMDAASDLIYFTLLTEGSAAGAESAARVLEPFVLGPVPADSAQRAEWLDAAEMYEAWQLVNGRTGTAQQTLGKLQAVRKPLEGRRPGLDRKIQQVKAQYATATRQPNALREAQRLDELLREQNVVWVPNLIAARLLEENGDVLGALQAYRRERVLATATREMARLSAQLGDREAAIREYQKYLLLRHDAEAGVQPEVEKMRRELAELVGE